MTPSRDVTVRPGLRDALQQVLLLAGAWLTYLVARHVFEGSLREARHHADQVWSLERNLGLPNESTVQDWILHSDTMVTAANAVYRYIHFPVTAIVLVLLFTRRRDLFAWFRDVLIWTTGLALIGHIVYPLAPPRLQPGLSVVDTGAVFDQSAYNADPGTGFTNQVAAMPSMHVAWAVAIALVVVRGLRTSWRWWALLYPVLIMFVVVVTGNHYWLDGLVGTLCLAVAIVIVGRRSPWSATIGP